MPDQHEHDENCRELFARMSEFIDGELDATDCRTIERHLAECKACRTCRATLERTVALCRNSAKAPIPEDLSRRLAEMLVRLKQS